MVGISSDVFNDWINGNTRSKLYFTEEGEPIEGSSVYIYKLNNKRVIEKPSLIHSQTVKKWKKICEDSLADDLTNGKGTDANKIFILKAVYHYAETAPVPVAQQTTQGITAHELKQLGTLKSPHDTDTEAIDTTYSAED